MEQIVNYIVQHPRRVIAWIVGILFGLFVIFFFLQNSIVMIRVTTDGDLQDSQATIAVETDQSEVATVSAGGSTLAIIPNSVTVIEASTLYESTVSQYRPTPFFTQVSLTLTPQVASKKLALNSGDCVYPDDTRIVSWECDTLESNTSQITYGSEFPQQQTISELASYSYQIPYQNGFLAISGGDDFGISYVDVSTDDYRATSLTLNNPVDSGDFNYATTKILIDPAHPQEFVVVDTGTGKYYYFTGGLTNSRPKLQSLPDFSAPEQATLVSLYDRVLTNYRGDTTDSTDDHSAEAQTEVSIPSITRFSIPTASKVGDSESFDQAVVCNSILTTKSELLCQQSTGVTVYDIPSKDIRLSLEEIGKSLVYNDTFYVTYRSGVYRINPSDSSLHNVFSIPGQSIASVSMTDGQLVASTWFSRVEGAQERITHQLELDKDATYPRVSDTLPFSFSENESITGSDFYDETVYISLLVPGSEYIYGQPQIPEEIVQQRYQRAKEKALDQLGKKGITEDNYTIRFYY